MSKDRQDGKSAKDGKFVKGVSGNAKGRPKKVVLPSGEVQDSDREFYRTDSKKFLERALYKASTWEEGLKFAKELRMLQHPSLQSVQTKQENAHTLTLKWADDSDENVKSIDLKKEEITHDDKEA